MIRKHVTAAFMLVLASAGGASAATSANLGSGSLEPVRVAAGACGKGFAFVGGPDGGGCVHKATDTAPVMSATAARSAKVPAAKVPCYGDGTTGPRIQFIYAHAEGRPNRAKTVAADVRNRIAPRMQAVINAQSLGQSLGLRFVMTKGCGAVDVKVLALPRDVQFERGRPRTASAQLSAIANLLADRGFDRGDRKYQVLLDESPSNLSVAGIAYSARDSEALSRRSEGYPTIGARTAPNNGVTGFTGGLTKYSLVFPRGMANGKSTINTQLHELLHNLGAVQLDAPHSDSDGHCIDWPSVMCNQAFYGQGRDSVKACERLIVEPVDCGMDDYWNPQPPLDSYLSTHLNIAKSQFFGPQPQDFLTASPL